VRVVQVGATHVGNNLNVARCFQSAKPRAMVCRRQVVFTTRHIRRAERAYREARDAAAENVAQYAPQVYISRNV